MASLLVLRHAKSESPHGAPADHDRPLAPRGLRDAPRMALHLAHAAPRPSRILCSTALRTRQTLDAVLAALPAPLPRVCLDPELYLATAGRLLTLLRALPAETSHVLLVGHNPGLEQLVQGLTGEAEPAARARLDEGLKTATLAVLELPRSWAELRPASARLTALVRPRDLDEDDEGT